MADKKNIAILVQKLYGGGAERTAANLSMSLQDRYNVHLIVFNGSDIKYPYGGTLHDLKLPASKNKLNRIRTFFKRVPAVKKIKQSENISVTISLMPGSVLSSGLGVFLAVSSTQVLFPFVSVYPNPSHSSN